MLNTRESWGNGDGRYLYPPLRDPNKPSEPIIEGHVNSIRWENLRDGMEDYEYFWMLKDLITKKSNRIPSNLLSEANELLVVPENVSKDLKTFNYNPQPLLEHRYKIGLMIEKLKRY